MKSIRSNNTVLLLGNADIHPDLAQWISQWPEIVVCADGGTRHLGPLQPALVVGDFDSSTHTQGWPSQQWIDQNLNDFEKALTCIEAPKIIGIGFLGGRWDHSLANLMTAARVNRNIELWDQHQRVRLSQDGYFHSRVAQGDVIGVIPVVKCHFSDSLGLRYPLAGLTLDPLGMVGSSNSATQDYVTIQGTGHYWVTTPNHLLALNSYSD